MAHSGLAVGLHPSIAVNSQNLHNRFDQDRAYDVTIGSEGGRLNLNYLVAGGNPARLAFLKQYLAWRGFTFQQCEVFVDCLLDWTGPAGKIRRPNGAPEGPGYHPPHRPLQSLDEIPLIQGSGPLVSRPHWKDELTLYSSGPLDLECVCAEFLGLIQGIGPQRAAQYVKVREARKAESPDGHPFKSIPEALRFLGLTQEQFAQLSGFLGFRDPIQRIRSVGTAGSVVRTVEVVARKNGANPQILWKSED